MRLILTAAALSLLPFAAQADVVPFDDQWEEQRFPFQKGNDYTKDGDTLQVVSDSAVSLMYRRTPDLTDVSTASWDWDVTQGVPATDLAVKGGDDRNLALYFVFADAETATRLEGASLRSLLGEDNARILVYVRGGQSAPNTMLDSPYLGERGKTIVLAGTETGPSSVSVDLSADLERAFDERPSELIGMAVSADADDTESQIDASISKLDLN